MRCRFVTIGGAVIALALTSAARSQATSRPCSGVSETNAGPACLLGRAEVGPVGAGAIYWRLFRFPDRATARRERTRSSTLVEAFGSTWLFIVGPLTAPAPLRAPAGRIGPLPLGGQAGVYVAEYLRSTFSPGMTAPVHVHSGPEAFFALTGGTCLETPEGVQQVEGPGSTLMIREGLPMLLMATGPDVRRGFALILHDPSRPPTTLTSAWSAAGLCRPKASHLPQ